jgi:class 3 adenylate cyclase
MVSLRATVLMKTDISGSTARFRALPESDLSAVLAAHRELVSRVAAAHEGQIVKPEGDSFWLVFPSVTAASQAAISMLDELELSQTGKGADRLAMRVVIALGDVLREGEAVVGDAVVLAARIEALTPPGEIYLSPSAWLAVNKAEVRTSPVGTFPLKGFDEPVPVYRVEPGHRTRVIANQYIVVADLSGFAPLSEASPVPVVEKILDELLEAVDGVCKEFGGTNRFGAGDSYCFTFAQADRAMTAVERLSELWAAFDRRAALGVPINLAVHKGSFRAYRTYVYGRGVYVAFGVNGAIRRSGAKGAIFLSEPVRQDLEGTPWAARLEPVAETVGREAVAVYRLPGGSHDPSRSRVNDP